MIRRYGEWDPSQQQAFIFQRFYQTVKHAFTNPFYRHYYADHGFALSSLRSFDDIKRVPVVTKAALRHCPLAMRSRHTPGRIRTNTGGTSGEPLEFYLSTRVFAREWAHLHAAWRRLGYRHTDLKLTFRGKTGKGNRALTFNPVHNEFSVSACHSQESIADEVRALIKRRPVRYIHGYPSTVYEFAVHCATKALDVRDQLRSSLQGILLASEYPAPQYRDVIEGSLEAPSLSWYGHSEMAVFAYETERFLYSPMQTYGYAEAVRQASGDFHLVGTTYDNFASPFIRYDTGDSIEPMVSDGLLQSFRITAGRIGDYIIDRNGYRVSLTALIFGRHHEAFRMAKFVQVRQTVPGEFTLRIVPSDNAPRSPDGWVTLFDLQGVQAAVRYELAEAPYRTSSGKAPLLIGR